MSNHQDHFTADAVDQQIEQQLNIPQQAAPESRLLHDLQSTNKQDRDILARARARLQPHFAQRQAQHIAQSLDQPVTEPHLSLPIQATQEQETTRSNRITLSDQPTTEQHTTGSETLPVTGAEKMLEQTGEPEQQQKPHS